MEYLPSIYQVSIANLPRAGSRLPGLPQRRAADALLPVLELLLLLHADVPGAGLPVLHHGGLHHRHGRRVPQVSEVGNYFLFSELQTDGATNRRGGNWPVSCL